MSAFLSDIKCAEGLNERQKVWVEQLKDVARKGDSLVAAYPKDGFLSLIGRFRFARDIYELMNEILDISERKNIYGIANIQGRRKELVSSGTGTVIQGSEGEIIVEVEHNDNYRMEENPHAPPASAYRRITELEQKFQLIRGEKQLMDALFCDVKEIGELDERSKIWVEQMQRIASENASFFDVCNSELEHTPMLIQILRYLVRHDIMGKIDRIRDEIEEASRRRNAYGLVQLQSRAESLSRVQTLRPRMQLPSLFDKQSSIVGFDGDVEVLTVDTNLPSYLRRCLFYFELFPADFEIPVRRLVVPWVAEGIVHHGRDQEPPELVAERYLTELIDRNMVQIVKRKPNGKVKTCHLSNALREVLARYAREHKNSTIRRMADRLDQNDDLYKHIHGNTTSDSASLGTCYKDVLSFLSFDTQEGSKPGQDLSNFLNLCISSKCLLLLRVLDLEGVHKPELPENIDKLTRLRYLGLRWTYLESLPSSISKLLKLQTLDLKHTYIHTLPGSIWKMELRHLFLSETYRTRFPPKPRGADDSLSDLQTLWGLFVDEETPVKGGLDKLVNIRKLGIACQSMSLEQGAMRSQLDAVADWIVKLQYLQSLRLKSRDEKGQPWNLHLKSLKHRINLTDMYLLGSFSSPSILSEFPQSLVELTLSHSRLEVDPMPILENLPNLSSLSLLAESYMGKKLTCHSRSFPQLYVLKVWKLELLEEWIIEKEALPSLRQLEIRSCPGMKRLPSGLEHVNCLLELKLTNMPKEINNG